jgi:type IV secretion system protein VirB9
MTRPGLAVAAVAISLFAAASVTAETFESRRVPYHSVDVVDLNCQVRFTTLIVLPAGEKILDFVVGDKDYWQLEGAANFAYVKPAKLKARTSITLITEAGNIYSFVAEEITGTNRLADIKVFVDLADEALAANLQRKARLVAADEADQLREKIRILETEERQRQDAWASEYATKLRFVYKFPANESPFYVSRVWTDGRSTYIQANAKDKPALYELTPEGPALTNYELNGNLYVVPKVLDNCYLQIGKKRLTIRSN